MVSSWLEKRHSDNETTSQKTKIYENITILGVESPFLRDSYLLGEIAPHISVFAFLLDSTGYSAMGIYEARYACICSPD